MGYELGCLVVPPLMDNLLKNNATNGLEHWNARVTKKITTCHPCICKNVMQHGYTYSRTVMVYFSVTYIYCEDP